MPLGKTQRRWKKAAEEAIAPEQVGLERDRMAAELARRVWVANGGPEWASAESEGTLLALETLVVRYLSDEVLQASLGLKYLRLLDEALDRADYEDVPALRAERQWVASFLEMSSRTGAPEAGGAANGGYLDAAGHRLEGFYQEMTQTVMAELKAAEIAAA